MLMIKALPSADRAFPAWIVETGPPDPVMAARPKCGPSRAIALTAVVANTIVVDGDAAEELIFPQPCREVREGVLGRAPGQPGQVVHRVAKVGKLPVDDHGDPPIRVHEVAGSRVTLDEHRRPVVGRQLALE